MQLGMVGLGKMGANMTTRLAEGGHQLVVTDLNTEAVERAANHANVTGAADLADLVSKMDAPRSIWVMVPAGNPTESTIDTLADVLSEGDTIIDGGNSNFNDTMRRAESLKEKGIFFVDVGTSGGVWGLKEGYSMMVGGEDEPVNRLKPILETLAPAADKGWGHVGAPGTGHFVKMVHNGIEYGMMQAYAEGFDLMKNRAEFELDMYQIAEIWRYGSVVRSWLLDLTADALSEDVELSSLQGYVSDSGEGRWTVIEAINGAVPAPVITAALFARFDSRRENTYANRLLAAMRNQFGGHAVKKADD